MRANRYYLITVLVVILLLTSLFYIMYRLGQGPTHQQIPITKSNRTKVQENPHEQRPITTNAPNLSDIKVVKELIITGQLQEVPTGMNTTREEMVEKYLYDCFYLEDMRERFICTEKYYANNDPDFMGGKQACQQSADKGTCLDAFYYTMAKEKKNIFCDGITDRTIRAECWRAIV
jgi:hypothetical protein